MIEGLERYFETPPIDLIYDYLEQIISYYSDEIMNDDVFHSNWLDSEIEHRWLWRLAEREVECKEAAKILERGFWIYKQTIIDYEKM